MSTRLVTQLALLWVHLYTRGLPEPVAQRRIEEIGSDLADQLEHERAAGLGEARIALHLLSRLIRGAAADVSWRRGLGPRAHRSVARPLLGVLCATALLLAIPLLAMQFTDEVVWTPIDFAVAAVLLSGTGFMFVWAARFAATRIRLGLAYKLAAGLALGTCLMLVWASLAVGIVGAEDDPADLMYIGVLAVGAAGAAFARLRPAGMSRTLVAMALVQMLVGGVAILAGEHRDPASSVPEILILNAFFAALFLGAASLFRLSAR